MNFQDELFQSLEERGWATSDHAIPPSLIQALRNQAHQLWQQGFFRPASVGRNAGLTYDPDIRGDVICWLEDQAPSAACVEFLAWADRLRQDLNRHFFLGLRGQEFHFARYEPGHGYARHMDQHRGTRARKVSVVLYLNEDWETGDGGELCLYAAEPNGGKAAGETSTGDEAVMARLLPEAGRMVVFLSDRIPHQVLPARRVRWSLTGWYRDDVQP